MAAPITVPRLGWTMEEGTFVDWLKQDGDRIQPGDALFVLESEKSAEEIEAMDAGVLRLSPDSPKAGDKVKVGQVVGCLIAEGEAVPAATPVATGRLPVLLPVATGSLPVVKGPTGKLPVATGKAGHFRPAPAVWPASAASTGAPFREADAMVVSASETFARPRKPGPTAG